MTPVAAVAVGDAAVPPLFVVVESEPLAPAPLAAVEAAPPTVVEVAAAALCGSAEAEAEGETVLEAPIVVDEAPLLCWMTEQFASIKIP